MSRLSDLGHRLYSGEVSFDIVGKRRRWYIISAVLVAISVGSLAIRGLNLGIEFHGGAEFQVPAASCSMDKAREAMAKADVEPVTVTMLGNESIRITTAAVDQETSTAVRGALGEACAVDLEEVSAQVVGPTWGGEITKKALTALAVFLALLTVFLVFYFDWRMAVSAMVALLHDIVITIGIYSVLQFEVTPSTVIGVLTILGYSLYDTVVVFDKVKENTAGILGQARRTYAQAANLAVNQTLVRSINTTIVALLPVGSILFVGAGILGAGTLKDLSLALFVGMAVGAYSSIFIATPLLVQLMDRDPQIQAQAKRVEARASGLAAKAAGAGQGGSKRDRKRRSGGKAGATTALAERPDTDAEADELGEEVEADLDTSAGHDPAPVTGPPARGGGSGGGGGISGFDTSDEADPGADAMARARARRAAAASGQRVQPKRQPRKKR